MRGRPKLVMTMRRKQVLEQLARSGGRISLAEVARRCGLFGGSDARRIVRDLQKMGAIKSIGHKGAELA